MSKEPEPQYQSKELLTRMLGIEFGIPPAQRAAYRSQFGVEQISVPFRPHVFFAQRVDLATIDSVSTLQDVMVILGHGWTPQDDPKRAWKFLSGKDVLSTVQTYNRFAQRLGWPGLDLVLACQGNVSLTDVMRAEKRGATLVYPRMPELVQPEHLGSPQIYPGSIVTINSSWKRADQGVELINATAIEWQGLEVWEGYWTHQQEQKADRKIPLWAMQEARR